MERKKDRKDKEIGQANSEFSRFVIHTAVYQTKLTQKFLNRKPYKPEDPKIVASQIPGTIRQVFVTTGQKVNEGDILLELEAMKMYNKILCPISGQIKAIHVKVGDKISKQFVMVEII